MRIALFTDTYLPTVNGVARTLGQLVSHAHRRGHEVALFSTNVASEPASGTVLHHQMPGVPLPMYPELQLAWPLDRIGKQRLEAFDPDLVHVATESTVGWSGRSWALRKGVPLVTSYHTDWPAYLSGYGFGGLETSVWRYLRDFHGVASATFCPSSHTLRQLRSRGFTNDLRIWSRGVDTELFNPSRCRADLREELAPEGEKIVLYVGRLAPEKRLGVLLEAFPMIREALGGRAVLALVGDGPWMSQLQAKAMEGVHLLGYRTGLALAEAYASGDLFAFPSDTETFGNVVTEALASGLPVVAPRKGGVIDSVIPGKTGVLVPPQDPRAMSEAVVSLVSNGGTLRELARGARAHAEANTWPAILDRLLSEYEEVRAGWGGSNDPLWRLDAAS
jgi:glycosyltransferase involved in cell wall biosynthesis